MLRDATTSGIRKIFIACGYTDLRKGIDGLSFMIQEEFNLNPLEKGSLFLFCGRKSDRIKGLLFEGLSVDYCYPHTFLRGHDIKRYFSAFIRKMCG